MCFVGTPSFSKEKIGWIPPFTPCLIVKGPKRPVELCRRRLEEEKNEEYVVVKLDGKERCVRRVDLMTKEEFDDRRLRLRKEGVLR